MVRNFPCGLLHWKSSISAGFNGGKIAQVKIHAYLETPRSEHCAGDWRGLSFFGSLHANRQFFDFVRCTWCPWIRSCRMYGHAQWSKVSKLHFYSHSACEVFWLYLCCLKWNMRRKRRASCPYWSMSRRIHHVSSIYFPRVFSKWFWQMKVHRNWRCLWGQCSFWSPHWRDSLCLWAIQACDILDLLTNMESIFRIFHRYLRLRVWVVLLQGAWHYGIKCGSYQTRHYNAPFDSQRFSSIANSGLSRWASWGALHLCQW